MEASFFTRHPRLKDAFSLAWLVALVLVGTLLINAFIFRSFSVTGPSMEETLHTGERLIVNRVPVTTAHAQNKSYVPKRGDIIVFENPKYVEGQPDRYIVKRVIAFAGEHVVVADGKITVYNSENPNGFNPDDSAKVGHPKSPSTGEKDMIVPDDEIFVAGDNRIGSYSYDSRNDLGTVPYSNIVGPVALRIWPLNKFTVF